MKNKLEVAIGDLGEEIAIDLIKREATKKHRNVAFSRFAPWDTPNNEKGRYVSYDYCMTIGIDDYDTGDTEHVVYLVEVKTKQSKNSPFFFSKKQLTEYRDIGRDAKCVYLMALVDPCSEKMYLITLTTLLARMEPNGNIGYRYYPQKRDGNVYNIAHYEPCQRLREIQDNLDPNIKTKSLFDPNLPL